MWIEAGATIYVEKTFITPELKAIFEEQIAVSRLILAPTRFLREKEERTLESGIPGKL
jgi:hypothetical protein